MSIHCPVPFDAIRMTVTEKSTPDACTVRFDRQDHVEKLDPVEITLYSNRFAEGPTYVRWGDHMQVCERLSGSGPTLKRFPHQAMTDLIRREWRRRRRQVY